MPDKSSSHLRLIWSQGAKDMSEAIAAEIRTICRHASEPIRAGETVKEQIRRAWTALDRPAFWRVRSGFAARAVDRVKQGKAAPTNVELARDDYRTLIARLEAVEAALRLRGPDAPGA